MHAGLAALGARGDVASGGAATAAELGTRVCPMAGAAFGFVRSVSRMAFVSF
jgi:hypothetical protein